MILFYIILYNYINYPDFIYIKQTLHYKQQQSKYNQRDLQFLYIVALCLFLIFSLSQVLQWLLQTVVFHLGNKKVAASRVAQVVVLYSNNCMGICLGGLSIGHRTQVVILKRWLFEQVTNSPDINCYIEKSSFNQLWLSWLSFLCFMQKIFCSQNKKGFLSSVINFQSLGLLNKLLYPKN